MTRHVQNPRERLYAEAVCGDTPWLTGGTGTRQGADCARCIAIYDQEYADWPDPGAGHEPSFCTCHGEPGCGCRCHYPREREHVMSFNSRPAGARPSPLLVAFREECEAVTNADADRLTMYPADWIRVATTNYWREPADGMLDHGIKVLRRLLDREMTGSTVPSPTGTATQLERDADAPTRGG